MAFGFQSGQVLILDSANGKPVHDLKRPGAIRSLAFSRDNRYLAIGSDLVRIWNTETREFLKLTYAHPSPVHSLVFKRQGKRLATATEAGKAQVFRVGPGETDDKPLFDPVPHAPSQYSAPQFFDLVRGLVTIELRGSSGRATGRIAWWNAENSGLRSPGQLRPREWQMSDLTVDYQGRHLAVGGHNGPQV